MNNKISFDVKLSTNKEKKQYIKNDKVKKFKNFIALPRTISNKIKIILVKDNNKYHVENHLLIITHSNINKLEKVYNMFINGDMNKYMDLFRTSVMLTTKEILSIPLVYELGFLR